MAAYTVSTPSEAGLAAVTEAAPAASGNTAPCGNGIALVLRTTSGPNTINVTVPAGITYHGLGIANATPGSGNRSLTVTNNTMGILPLPTAVYADPTTGLATFAVTGTLTGVLCSVISVPAS
jgi:hypothetical protein